MRGWLWRQSGSEASSAQGAPLICLLQSLLWNRAPSADTSWFPKGSWQCGWVVALEHPCCRPGCAGPLGKKKDRSFYF